MTQDEIIEMAKKSGASPDGRLWLMYSEDLVTLAKLVEERTAAKEREACAMVCDELQAPPHVSDDDMSMWDVTSMECADAIRARAQADRGEA